MPMAASAGSNVNLLDQFVKQQGVAVWGENDEPEEFLLSLLPPHELIIHVEHCLHTRPSRTGSLRGSAQMYMDQSQLLEAALKPLQGGGSVTVVANDRARAPDINSEVIQPAAAAASSSSRPGSRPCSATSNRSSRLPASPLQPLWSEQRDSQCRSRHVALPPWPRIGAFEVAFTLYNRDLDQSYGPFLVYSKLQSRLWPSPPKLYKNIHRQLQDFLKKDEGATNLHGVRPPSHHTHAYHAGIRERPRGWGQ